MDLNSNFNDKIDEEKSDKFRKFQKVASRKRSN